MSRYRYTIYLICMLLLALLPRLWLWADQGSAWMVYPGDQDEYYRGSIHILLDGSYYDDGQWLRPPMTSIFLAGIFALVGVHIPLAMLAQCLLSLLTLLLLAELARSLFHSRSAGLAAAAMGAVFLPYASYASQMLSETLFIFTITAALLLLEAARRRGMAWHWLGMAGMVWGVATLTRPVGLYAVPLLLLWVGVVAVQSTAPLRMADGLTGVFRFLWRAALSALPLLLGFLVILVPWSARNYAIHGHLILVDTNGGTSFWLGNLLEPDERELQFVWNRTIPNLAEREDAALTRALDNIQREPLLFLSRTRNKAVSLWQFDTRLFIANAPIGITLDERSLAFALASDAQYILIMLLALVGIVLARPAERSLPLLLWPLYGTLLSAVSLGHPRLRLPLLVAFFVYAALPLAHPQEIWARLRAASWVRRLLLLAALVGLCLVWYARVYPPFVQSQAWLVMARLTGDTSYVDQAVAITPDSYLPYATLGDIQRQQGDFAGARNAYAQAATYAPQNTYIHAERLDLARRMENEEQMQAAMNAIAAVGWDNNQLYAWAWRHLPTTTDARLDVAAPAPGVMQGVYAPEQDEEGRVFRWTLAHTQMRFSLPGANRLSLLLRADASDTPVRVFYQGEEVTTLSVGTGWQQFDIPLPPHLSRSSPQLVELRTATSVHSTAEPYPRGVALAGAQLMVDE